jgi:hypothetical protein
MEGFQQPVELICWDSVAAVCDRQDCLVSLGLGRGFDVAAGDVVLHCVVDEVRDKSFDQPGIASDRGRRERLVDCQRPALTLTAMCAQHALGELPEIGWFAVFESALAAGEGQ